jgi:hypothetical protein
MIRLLDIPTLYWSERMHWSERPFRKLRRWTPAWPRSRERERVTPQGPQVKTSSCRDRLLAGGARIHVDFHADRHFDDLWCLPGHLALLVDRTNSALRDKLMGNENFASKIFSCCVAKGFHLIVLMDVK